MVPVKWWAGLGAVILAFIAYVLITWVSGPFFQRVPTGPTDPPTFMKVAMVFFQAVSIPIGIGLIGWFVVRPIIRQRRLTLDGMLVIAFSTLWFQDPLSAYGGHWFTYNSWAINYGSWVHAVPGWLSNGKPGAMVVEPIMIMPGLYVYVFVITMFLGCWAMRRAKAKWPQIGTVGLIGVCFATMVGFDIILEGVIFMPLGIWEYPGGRGFAIFGGTYHAFPLNEVVTVSATFTAVACLRYFRNDRGQTLVERGSERLRMSDRSRDARTRTRGDCRCARGIVPDLQRAELLDRNPLQGMAARSHRPLVLQRRIVRAGHRSGVPRPRSPIESQR